MDRASRCITWKVSTVTVFRAVVDTSFFLQSLATSQTISTLFLTLGALGSNSTNHSVSTYTLTPILTSHLMDSHPTDIHHSLLLNISVPHLSQFYLHNICPSRSLISFFANHSTVVQHLHLLTDTANMISITNNISYPSLTQIPVYDDFTPGLHLNFPHLSKISIMCNPLLQSDFPHSTCTILCILLPNNTPVTEKLPRLHTICLQDFVAADITKTITIQNLCNDWHIILLTAQQNSISILDKYFFTILL